MFERYREIEGFLFVPFTGNNYLINLKGEIKGKDGFIIPHVTDCEGNATVYVSMWDGFKYYKVSLILALTFKPVRIPYHHWHKLDLIFADDDNKNIHPSNLIWKFPNGGLIHSIFLDYAYIPGYSQFVIDKQGNLLHASNGKSLNCHPDKKYLKYKLIPDIGNISCIGRHRLICLAWLQYNRFVDKLVTNHINGILGDDRLENLEWVTRLVNNIHAINMGVRSVDSTILVRNILTNEIKEFSGYISCAKYFGLNKDTIKFRVLAKNQPVYPGYLQFKLKSNIEDWREVKNHIDRKLHNGFPVSINARNIVTGEVLNYASIADCGRAIDCVIPTIHSYLKHRKVLRPIRGYDFKFETDTTPWPIHSENEITVYLANPVGLVTGVVLTDTETNEDHVFTSNEDAAKFLDRCTSLVSHAIKKKTLIKNRYLAKRI